MECPTKSGEGPELFIAYAAQALPGALAVALERHCNACMECRAAVEAQKRVWSALESWEPEYISTSFDRRLFTRIAAEEQRRATRWFLRPAIPVAAACAFILAGYLLRTPPAPPAPEPRLAIENRVDMEQVERALDDIDMLKQMGVVLPAS
jgi:D-mannonate dehydratase